VNNSNRRDSDRWPLLGRLTRGWRWPIASAAVLALAGAVVVGRASNAAAYLANDADGCLNCHVMTNAHGTWARGSHGRFTVCNDCHVPHTNPVATVAFKATDGMRHSWVFTLRREPQVLRLNAAAVPVIQENCLRCHADRLTMIRLAGASERTCWGCHQGIHGEVRSLSSSPFVRRSAIPAAGLLGPETGTRSPVMEEQR
jgi:cytochrome c nitrite reductase small subunit